MNISITMHCSTVTVAVANHWPCHANKENLDRWKERDKAQDVGKRLEARDGQRPGVNGPRVTLEPVN